MVPKRFFFGLDLGQAADYSALAIVERPEHEDRTAPCALHCRHLQRWPLRTSYPQIVADVARMVRSDEMRRCYEEPVLAVDGTGVGPPVVDLFREEFDHTGPYHLVYSVVDVDAGLEQQMAERVRRRNEVYLMPVVITGGDTVTRDKHATRVPKRDLVSVTQVAFQTDRLKVAARLKEAATLTNELMSFKVKISLDTAHDSYGAWREGQHDDLVLAVCLALWSSDNLRETTVSPEALVLFERLAAWRGVVICAPSSALRRDSRAKPSPHRRRKSISSA